MSNYYESNAERYASETFSADMSEQYQRFLPLLKKRAKILDVGSGSGRDAFYFQKHGYQVTALEASKNLGREIRKVFLPHSVLHCFRSSYTSSYVLKLQLENPILFAD